MPFREDLAATGHITSSPVCVRRPGAATFAASKRSPEITRVAKGRVIGMSLLRSAGHPTPLPGKANSPVWALSVGGSPCRQSLPNGRFDILTVHYQGPG